MACLPNLTGVSDEGCPTEITPPPSGTEDMVPLWNATTGCIQWTEIGMATIGDLTTIIDKLNTLQDSIDNLACPCSDEFDSVNTTLAQILASIGTGSGGDCDLTSVVSILDDHTTLLNAIRAEHSAFAINLAALHTALNDCCNLINSNLNNHDLNMIDLWSRTQNVLAGMEAKIDVLTTNDTAMFTQLDSIEQCACGSVTLQADMGVQSITDTGYQNPCVTSTVTLVNNGPDPATNATAALVLSGGTTQAFQSCVYAGTLPGVTCTVAGNSGTISIPSMPIGTETFTIVFCDDGNPDPGTEYFLEVTVSADETDPNMANNVDFGSTNT